MIDHRPRILLIAALSFFIVACLGRADASDRPKSDADRQFEQLGERFIDKYPALTPVAATAIGDHRFDGQLDQISAVARNKAAEFYRNMLRQLDSISREKLTRPRQVDYSRLRHHLRYKLWRLEELQEWAWNPLIYTELSGGAIYGLMARDFTSQKKRLRSVTRRLEQFPRFFRQVRETLVPDRVPRIHAQTAVKQNRGVLSIMENMVKPLVGELPPDERERLKRAMRAAQNAIAKHQNWLEAKLSPQAKGDFRLGAKMYDEKLAFELDTPLTRREIRQRAEAELFKVRESMYGIATRAYKKRHPFTKFPQNPGAAYKQAMIRAALEMAYEEMPAPGGIVEAAKRSLKLTTDFVRAKDLLTIPAESVEIIVMPEFQRGVSLAYCDAPGALDAGQKTFYAVAPLPKEWSAKQVKSFLREYNIRSIHNLTVHEAMPGHFVQLAHANRYPGKLRSVLASGTFIEGWAVYTEQMMREQGFLDGDLLMQLITLKWYLRGIANAILDQAIHVEDMTREQAMKLMIEDTFQEEREAAGKWVRAQLTSAQLATYFVGFQEHADLRREAQKALGSRFSLKQYHNQVISYGSPPVRFVRALLLEKAIPN